LSGTKATAREVSSFNEGWVFKRGPFATEAMQAARQWESRWDSVSIPHTWNARDMQEKVNDFYEGVGYYRKRCFFGKELEGKRVFLRFEGVGACAEVYLNGQLVGSHKGGYSAFVCELTKALKTGQENEVTVKADNAHRPDVIPVNQSLFGVYGGIYRPVSLIVT
jgi:beta-galactosidase